MNGLPATIVIRHLMGGPTPIARRPAPTTSRTTGRRHARSLALRVAVPLVVVAIAISAVFVLAALTVVNPSDVS
jgi:hypothetical protein